MPLPKIKKMIKTATKKTVGAKTKRAMKIPYMMTTAATTGVIVEAGKDGTYYEVDKVVGCRRRKGKREYLIRWKGCGQDEDTWEPRANLCVDALKEAKMFDAEQKAELAQKKAKKASPIKKKIAAKSVGRMSIFGVGGTNDDHDKDFDKLSEKSVSAEQDAGADSAEVIATED